MPIEALSRIRAVNLDSTPSRERCVLDVETCSEVDLEVVGSHRYARHLSTRLTSVAFNYIGTDVSIPWVPAAFWSDFELLGPTFDNIPRTVLFQAYNDTFDRLIWKHVGCRLYGWPDPDEWQWECLMQRAAYFNLPGKLDAVAQVLGTPRKDPAGHALMLKLCKPARPIIADRNPWRLHTPENLAALGAYNLQDVAAESPLDGKIPRLPACELPVVKADRAMNERGIQVDLTLVEQLGCVADSYSQHLQEQLAYQTHGDVTSATQLPALRRWLLAHGAPLREGPGSLDRYAIDGFLDGEDYDGNPLARPLDDDVIEVLGIRRKLGKSSLAKLESLRLATCADGRVRGMFQYYGADRSGRWAGRIVQPQNLPKGVLVGAEAYDVALAAINAESGSQLIEMLYGDQVMDVLASCLRCCLTAGPGRQLVVVDYNAIECRMAAWFAGEEWMLQAFRQRLDLYKQMASWIYQKPIAEITKAERNDGKLAELSCQYGLGKKSLRKQAKQKAGRILTEEQAKHIVDTYRLTHAKIKQRWYELEEAAHRATREPGTRHDVGPVAFRHDGTHLKLRLPVGRCITFHQARIEMRQPPWDTDELRPVLTYMGEDSVTHQWKRQTAWGGDFMAISCQGMSRDLVAHALVKLEAENFGSVLTVHDEIGCDVDVRNPGFSVEAMTDIMCDLPAWANGLPVTAEGFMSPFYHK